MSHINIAHNGHTVRVYYSGHGSDLVIEGVHDGHSGKELDIPFGSAEAADIYARTLEADREEMMEQADLLRDQLREN